MPVVLILWEAWKLVYPVQQGTSVVMLLLPPYSVQLVPMLLIPVQHAPHAVLGTDVPQLGLKRRLHVQQGITRQTRVRHLVSSVVKVRAHMILINYSIYFILHLDTKGTSAVLF